MIKNILLPFIILIFNLIVSCKSIEYKKPEYPNIPFELQFLSHFRTDMVEKTNEVVIEYEKLKLKRIIKDSESEFWIAGKKVITVPKSSHENCYIREIFKKNFLLISKSNCNAAGPDLIERKEVILVDLNSHKTYTIDFEEFMLTRSKKAVDEFYSNSEKYSAIFDVNVEKRIIRITNNKIGIRTFDMIIKE
ncbi:hypothetical protein [Aquimarina sediminis]|uniref:hypothetical protein n=1 Tax=Aquimarina sediminis TaxID=2070536 RepID=UPI000CA05383|nr:hypothetical protein [Aquimarina sediminis]